MKYKPLLGWALALYLGSSVIGASASQDSRAAINLELHQTLVKEHYGFAVGKTTDGGGPTYVFFDPQCQHCMQLWQQAKPLLNKHQMIWIPVHLLGEASLLQGAALLDSKAPAKLMDQQAQLIGQFNRPLNDQLRAQGKNKAKASASEDKVRANLVLLKKLGYDSVPFVARYDAKTNTFSADLGSMTTAGLEDLLKRIVSESSAP